MAATSRCSGYRLAQAHGRAESPAVIVGARSRRLHKHIGDFGEFSRVWRLAPAGASKIRRSMSLQSASATGGRTPPLRSSVLSRCVGEPAPTRERFLAGRRGADAPVGRDGSEGTGQGGFPTPPFCDEGYGHGHDAMKWMQRPIKSSRQSVEDKHFPCFHASKLCGDKCKGLGVNLLFYLDARRVQSCRDTSRRCAHHSPRASLRRRS